MVVIWQKTAKKHLRNYFLNSRIYSKNKLQIYINSLVKYSNSLKIFPFLGKSFNFYQNIEIRQLLYKMHRIFYYIKNDKIYIIAVINTSRDINIISKHLNKILNQSEINL